LWTLVDQGLSSFTNLALGFIVANAADDTKGLGVFGLVFAIYTLTVATKNAVISQPLMLRFSDRSREDALGAASAAQALAHVLGLGGGALVILLAFPLGAVVGSGLGPALLALGVGLPGLLSQDAARYVYYTLGKPQGAAFNDGLWALLQLPTFAWLLAIDAEIWMFFAVWGLSATLCAVVAVLHLGLGVALAPARRWWARHGELGRLLLAEQGLVTGSEFLATWIQSLVAGLVVVGALQGAMQLNGVGRLVALAALPVLIPELRRLVARNPRPLVRVVLAVGAVLGALLVGLASVALVVPDSFGEELLGESWADATAVVVPIAAMLGAKLVSASASIGLKVLDRERNAMAVRMWSAPLFVVAAVGGAWLGDADGAAYGSAAAAAVGALGMIVMLRRCHRERLAAADVDGSKMGQRVVER
jgi:O-antigen/teichoic acid export membrane protein